MTLGPYPFSAPWLPAYRRLARRELESRVLQAEALLRACILCPRQCHADRTAGQLGFCRTADRPVVSSWGPHFGEERPLVGRHGSGTIFFSHCNLACLFCQNYTISQLGEGSTMSIEDLARVMLDLQSLSCHNINLVTPTHQLPMILRALLIAAEAGLNLPLVYNCGGYEALPALRLLDGIVDIYMPDLKYMDPDVAVRFSDALDYPQAAQQALREMHRQVGDLLLDSRGIARRGLLVRHLVLPENLAGTVAAMQFLAREISPDTYVNLMDQYRPCFQASRHPPLDRRLASHEFRAAIDSAMQAGLYRLDGIASA